MAINIDVSNLVGMTLDNTTFDDVSPHLNYVGCFTLNEGLVISEIPYIIIDYGIFTERANATQEQDGRFKVIYNSNTGVIPINVTAYGVALEKSNLIEEVKGVEKWQ